MTRLPLGPFAPLVSARSNRESAVPAVIRKSLVYFCISVNGLVTIEFGGLGESRQGQAAWRGVSGLSSLKVHIFFPSTSFSYFIIITSHNPLNRRIRQSLIYYTQKT